jgi:hypothetical protein
MDVELPLISVTDDAREAYTKMAQAGKSGSVLKEGDEFFLLTAGAVFLAIKHGKSLKGLAKPLSRASVKIWGETSITVPEFLRESSTGAIIRVRDLEAPLLESGPAACYCPNGHPGRAPGKCDLCDEEFDCE